MPSYNVNLSANFADLGLDGGNGALAASAFHKGVHQKRHAEQVLTGFRYWF